MPDDSKANAALQGIAPTQFPEIPSERRPLGDPKFLRNAWYVAMYGSDLPEGELKHRTILNEPILFYRKEDGGVAAIRDRCPHRFVPLSMGKLCEGDTVQCIYHGLEFGPDGRCVKNPHGKGTLFDGLNLPSFPVVEKHSMLWIWMGDKPADTDAIPDYSCLDDRPASHITEPGYIKVKAHYQLVVDNLLDLSHINYTHAGILGNADQVKAEVLVEQDGDVVTVSRDTTDTETPGVLKLMAPPDLERGDVWNSISWFAPSNLLLQFGISHEGTPKEDGVGYNAIHFLTPETERTTHYHYTAARYGVRTTEEENQEIRALIYKMRTFAFADQDIPVIEGQQIAMDSAVEELTPALLSVDAGPNRYERILDRLLREEGS